MKAQDALTDSRGSSPISRRVIRVYISGKTAWAKDFDVPSPPKWHNLQSVLFFVTRAQMLRPVRSKSGVVGAATEVEAMGRFRQIGAHVPELILACGARIVVSDIGQTLRDIEHRGGETAIQDLATAAAIELGRIHAAGLVHGRPILRNLTWDGTRIGFIDFEEDPLSVMPQNAAQGRDVLVFLISLARRNSQQAVSRALRAYSERMASDVEAELRRVSNLARPLAGWLGELLVRAGGRDLAGLVRAVRALDGMAE